jgi:hypothetical protein
LRKLIFVNLVQKRRVPKRMKFLKSSNKLMILLCNRREKLKVMMVVILNNNKKAVKKDKEIKINNKIYLI